MDLKRAIFPKEYTSFIKNGLRHFVVGGEVQIQVKVKQCNGL